MTFDEIINGTIDRLTKKKEHDLTIDLYQLIDEYTQASYEDPFGLDVKEQVDALVTKLALGIRDAAGREVTQKLLRIFD